MNERGIIRWLLGRDTGLSSKCIVAHLYGIDHDGSYPHDPDDLGRCLRLLTLYAELRERFDEMRSASAAWAALVDRWGDLHRSMDEEVGIAWQKGREAPKTYALMRSILDPIERHDPTIVARFGYATLRSGR